MYPCGLLTRACASAACKVSGSCAPADCRSGDGQTGDQKSSEHATHEPAHFVIVYTSTRNEPATAFGLSFEPAGRGS